MRRKRPFVLRVFVSVLAAASALATAPVAAQDEAPRRVLFGSCLDPRRPHPILEAIAGQGPDLFIFTGDNVYADTSDPVVLAQRYRELGDSPGFRRLKAASTLLATWDDHDYGTNDAGGSFAAKRESRERFLEFWQVPPGSKRRAHEGVYDSAVFGPPERRVQVILLDTRFFRSPLRWGRLPAVSRGPYLPDESPGATILGEEQWHWLEERLLEPARLRLIVSSIQVLSAHHGWEAWANFPLEQQRLLDLLRRTRAAGVLFLSGDRHMAEVSRVNPPGLYPLWDVTSSSLNLPFPASEANLNGSRVGAAYLKENFGALEIDWQRADALITVRILDVEGREAIKQEIALSSLSLPP